ncbi:MAG: hypothetical protein J5I92_10600 [Thiogranum sp.]|nr:hypothetical protein [Thiogranum sp.]
MIEAVRSDTNGTWRAIMMRIIDLVRGKTELADKQQRREQNSVEAMVDSKMHGGVSLTTRGVDGPEKKPGVYHPWLS